MTERLVLENARIVDGTGAPWFRGSVSISDGRIDGVVRGSSPDPSDATTVDVEENIVCPGFIDTHSHSDVLLFSDPTLEPKLRQGITTEVVGPDGFSMAPMYREGGSAEWSHHLSGLVGDAEADWEWGSVGEYLNAVERRGVAPNVATFVGHGAIRYDVLGMSDREPTTDELDEMCALVREGLDDGAVGLSTGLVYAPQAAAGTDELVALAEELAPYGRPFRAHIRSESRGIWAALSELFRVGERASVPVHIDHYKLAGAAQYGLASRSNALIEAARARGIDVTAEQYPYAAGNTMLSAVLPPWVHAEGPGGTLSRIADPEVRERIRRDVEEWRIEGWENTGFRSGWENVVVTGIEDPEWAEWDGESVATIAEGVEDTPIDVVCDLLYAEDLDVSMVLHVMDEADVREILRQEWVSVCTDGLLGGKPHPRTYGSYPRVLGTYVREEKLLSLPEAIRKMTSLPARAMGFERKGLVREGMDADLVVFDPGTVESPASYDEPRQFPRGIGHVVVNGAFAVRDGETTGTTPGAVIRMGE
jgi:N-acyl-D-amino-acid deacylase